MTLRKITASLILLTLTLPTIAQDAPTPAEQRLAQLEQEIELLKKQQEYEKAKGDLSSRRLQELMNLMPRNSSLKTMEGDTEFADDKDSNTESVALSFEALKEVTGKINGAMRGNLAQYSGLVIYNEPDFLALAKYRLYRSQSKIALKNYDQVAANLERMNRDAASNPGTMAQNDRFRTKSLDPLSLALSLPGIGTSYAKSVAELFSVFRTDTTITQSKDTLDNTSLSTAMANELKRANPNLQIYYPQAFVAEYDLETDGEDSLFAQMSRLNEAQMYLADFAAQTGKIPEQRRNSSPLRETISLAETVKKQLQSLTLAEASNSRSEPDAAKPNMSEFRQLIRAEKLDRFLRGNGNLIYSASTANRSNSPRVGILKLRVLASGGSRRETRNFFTGNKVSYSGSAIIEVLLFDADGTLRVSEIFSSHTGFRKMKASDK